VIVWLWDAHGPVRRGLGVSGDQAGARRAAEACLVSGQASAARVEEALAMLGIGTLASHYWRTGQGWQASRADGGGIRWEPLAVSPAAEREAQ
jgi:hypothetical protein